MKTALVTGGSRGIGRAIADELVAAGHRVVVCYRQDEARAARTVQELQARGGEAVAIAADVTNAAEVRSLGDRISSEFGGADILVNNAGVIKDALFPLMKEEDWDFVLDTDLKGAFRVTKAVVRGMLHKGWGRIVNVVSVSGISGHAGQTNYSAAKAGLVADTDLWAKELARYGIRTGAIAPGFVDTPILQGMKPEVLEGMLKPVPLRRVAKPEEIYLAVKFIIECDYFTGRCIDIDGGMRL